MSDAFSLSRQAQWETLGFRRAIERYRDEAAHKDWSELSAGQTLLRAIVPPLSDLIAAAQAHAATTIGQPGRQPEWAWTIQLVPADKLAVITVMVALRSSIGSTTRRNSGDEGGTVLPCARAIAAAVKVQVEYDRWAKEAPDVEKILRKRYPKVDKRVWAKWRKKVDAARCEPWGVGQETALGAHLIGLLVEAAPSRFALETKRLMGSRTYRVLVPSQATLELIDDVTARAEVARPLHMPMICPPLPWKYEEKSSV